MNLSDLDGVGPVRLESLRAMGIVSLRDLLYMLPVRYEDHQTTFPCNEKKPGMILVAGQFQQELKTSYFHGISRVQGSIADSSGKLSVCWYNEPWIAKQISPGTTIRLYGRLVIKDGRRILQNPKIITDCGWIPVYKALKGIPSKSFRNLIRQALDHLEDCCPETLPSTFRLRHRLCELNFALREAHFPSSMINLEIARRRLTYERILIYLLYISLMGNHRNNGNPFSCNPAWIETYWNSLPFEATASQRKVLAEIADDLSKTHAMARLIQGDVGSGKTAVAFGAVYIACSAGFQASMMAPTEILASQHYENACKILEPLGIKCRLLTGNTKARERRMILEELQSGICQAIFGTHALTSNDVKYSRLGLVITDEQHRFGVQQRTALQEKGTSADQLHPHVLVMSATPIPRTLALIIYGDLDISVISELPKGRKPVKTRIVPESKRESMYHFLCDEIKKGHQAYIVCPMVEESDSEAGEELKSAKSVFEELRSSYLHEVSVALTWGSQKSDEKEKILSGFLQGSIDVLVATTVIEVGINNPNASIMIVENAERFGLSQLHQLRGRVGRGTEESWCFLLGGHTEKLDVLCQTNDGFIISKKDMELRGPGDLIGTRQSGDTDDLSFIHGDAKLLEEVSDSVRTLLHDPSQSADLEALAVYVKSWFESKGQFIELS